MSIELIANNFKEAQQLSDEFVSNENNLKRIVKAGNLMVVALQSKNKIFSCGNGGSMCDAMHFSEELTGRFRNSRKALPAIAISDPSHISCVANDFGYEYIFSTYIEAMGKKNDVLLAISTSGNSLNVINAAKAAKKLNMKIVSLTGKNGGKLAHLSDIEIRVPWNAYSDRIQEVHIKILHSLVHYIEAKLLLA